MKTNMTGVPTPQANIAINKSRIKLYGKNSKVPTYYLKKGQEFEIELFNPTKDTIMAKISLNGKPIAQGGLVLKPGVRVFLDRYIDVARKFKFDTYEVGNTAAVKKAIEDNGDFKVEFYREEQHQQTYIDLSGLSRHSGLFDSGYYNGNTFGAGVTNIGDNYGTRGVASGTAVGNSNINTTYTSNVSDDIKLNACLGLDDAIGFNTACMDAIDFAPEQEMKREIAPKKNKKVLKSRSRVQAKKTIETGRVEEGSRSDQTMEKVYMNWESFPFHTIEYKMLPVSQKVNTVSDIRVKRYCTSCGTKQKPNFKFCPSCGARV